MRKGKFTQVASVICALAFLTTSCAPTAGSIVGSHVSTARYSHLDCSQLNYELSDVKQKLASLSHEQGKGRGADTALLLGGLFLFWPLLLAMPFVGKDHSDPIADLKGQLTALKRAHAQNNCY